MSPPPAPLIVDTPQQPDLIGQLIDLLNVFPPDEPSEHTYIPWQNLVVGDTYWGISTGFGGYSHSKRFTVSEVWTFPDGGAMVITDVPAVAWGVGASCESAVGPRNRFWAANNQS
jgi:hypothetical protein